MAVKVPLGDGCRRGRAVDAGENVERPEVHCDVEEGK